MKNSIENRCDELAKPCDEMPKLWEKQKNSRFYNREFDEETKVTKVYLDLLLMVFSTKTPVFRFLLVFATQWFSYYF